MKCKYCKNDGLVKVRKRLLCKEHFNQYYYKRVKKVLRNVPIKNKKILIALSGGKDSVAILHFFSIIKDKYKFNLEAIFIDLGIEKFSSNSLDLSVNLCKSLGISLNVVSVKEQYKKTIDDIAIRNKKVCAICGTVKRYVINDFAYKNSFDFVITGHNMNDEIIFLKQNILGNQIDYIKRYTRFYTETLPEVKLIGKIKPQFFITEQDNLNYCIVNNLEFISDTCPYSEKTPHKKLEYFIQELDKKMDYSLSFINFFIKINEYLPEKKLNYKFCSKCGYPTVNKDICKFCKIMND